jgi:hypothetical protein
MATETLNPVDTSDIAIWSRLMGASSPAISPEAARILLQIGFAQPDKERMSQLAVKSNDGALSDAERIELENYVRVGHLLALMHLKARRRLGSEDESGQST